MRIIGEATFAARAKRLSGIAHDHGHGFTTFLHHLEKNRWFGPENFRPRLKVRGMSEEVRRQLELTGQDKASQFRHEFFVGIGRPAYVLVEPAQPVGVPRAVNDLVRPGAVKFVPSVEASDRGHVDQVFLEEIGGLRTVEGGPTFLAVPCLQDLSGIFKPVGFVEFDYGNFDRFRQKLRNGLDRVGTFPELRGVEDDRRLEAGSMGSLHLVPPSVDHGFTRLGIDSHLIGRPEHGFEDSAPLRARTKGPFQFPSLPPSQPGGMFVLRAMLRDHEEHDVETVVA